MITAEGNTVSAENATITNNKDEDFALESEVQKKLQLPLFWGERMKKFISALGTKVWQLLHYPIGEKFNLVTFVSIILIIASVVFVSTMLKFRPNKEIITSEKYSVFGQLEELKAKHKYFYQVATPLEKWIKWKTMFYGWKYKLNGDPKTREADCVGAVYTYYRAWGSNFRLESVPWLIKRINNLKEKYPEMIRTSLYQIKPGDIVILKYSEANQHVGIVMDTPNNRIEYVSMNVGVMKEGTDLISFSDPAIVFISEINFELWAGDTFEELSKI